MADRLCCTASLKTSQVKPSVARAYCVTCPGRVVIISVCFILMEVVKLTFSAFVRLIISAVVVIDKEMRSVLDSH